MNNPPLPPTPPPQPLQVQTTPSVAPSRPIVHEAPIRHAPPELRPSERPVQIEGRVISSNSETKEIRVQTSRGEIVVQSSANIPPGTDVVVQLYMDKGKELANIIVLKQDIAVAKELEKMIAPKTAPPPPPPLKAGDVVVAIELPSTPPPEKTALPSTPVPLEKIITFVEKLTLPEIQKLPLPPEILKIIAEKPATDAVKEIIQKFPPEQVAKIMAFIRDKLPAEKPPLETIKMAPEEKIPVIPSLPFVPKTPAMAPLPAPNIIQKFMATYLPQIFGSNPALPTEIPPPATPSLPQAKTYFMPSPVSIQTPMPDTFDNNLLNIVKAQIGAKLTYQAIQQLPATTPSLPQSPTPPPALGGNISSLLSIIENIQQPKDFFPQATLPQQLVPQFLQSVVDLPKNMVEIKIIRILPPDTPLAKIQEALPAPAVPTILGAPLPQIAQVETITSGGFPILKTADSHFVVKAPASIPVGSFIVFEVTPMTPEKIIQALQPVPTGYTPDISFDPLMNTAWPALQEALQTLTQTTPDTAQILKNSLPSPTPRLVPTALFFLAALRLGGIENWLGDKSIQSLRQSGKKDLIEKLTGDFGKISAQSKEPASGEWRAISMPLLHDDHIHQMQFYVRQDHDKDGDKGENKKTTRFILNLHLSRMGDMQLDGLIRQKKFDMVLRSEDSLPFDMRQELMQRFAAGLAQVSMEGALSFQSRQQSWVHIDTVPENQGRLA